MYVFCFQYVASLNSQNKEVLGHLEATFDTTLQFSFQAVMHHKSGIFIKS